MAANDTQHNDQPIGSFKRMPLLDAEELAFYKTLSSAINDSHVIFTKIPLENIIHPSSHSDKSFLAFTEIDYLVCDKATSLPICVIDVDSTDYPTPLSYLLNVSGIAVVRLEADLTAEELRQKIAAAKPITNMKYPGHPAEVAVSLVEERQGGSVSISDPLPKRPFPKITLIPETKMHRYITYGHWIIWSVFCLAFILLLIYVFSR